MTKTLVIVNPTAGGGRGRSLWPEIEARLKKTIGPFDLDWKEVKGEARRISEKAANYELIVACGGDGTVQEVANGLFLLPSQDRPTLGILSLGTGSDLIRTLGIAPRLSRQIEILKKGRERTIDLGEIEYQTPRGRERRVFLNIADAGMGAEVLRRMKQGHKGLARRFSYLLATLESYVSRKPIKMNIILDEKGGWQDEVLIVAVANGRFFGGGMKIAPRADPADGMFDLVVLRDIPPHWIPVAIPLLYAGKFDLLPQIEVRRAREIELSSEEEVELDVDGELIGSLPSRFKILPRELRIKVP